MSGEAEDVETSTEDEEALCAALGRLYAVFRRYPSQHRGAACPHCVSDAEKARLHAAPLASVSWDDFGAYPLKAMTTWGDADELKHFLPRLLELVACGGRLPARPSRFADDEAPYDVELMLGKLDYARIAAWPDGEREAVEACLRARLRLLLGQPPGRPTPGAWVLQAACSGLSVTPLLDDWAADARPQAALHLAAWVLDRLPDLVSGRIRSAFLDDRRDTLREITAWLRSRCEWLMAAAPRCGHDADGVWEAAERLLDLHWRPCR